MSFHEPYAWLKPKAWIGQLGVQETLKNELPWSLYNAWLKPKTWIGQLGVQETLKNELPWTLYYAWLKPKTWWIGQLGVQETLKSELPWTLYNAWLKPETWIGGSGVQENPKKWASIMNAWLKPKDLDQLVDNVSHYFFGGACNFTTSHMGQSFNPKSSTTTTKTMLGCAHARKGALNWQGLKLARSPHLATSSKPVLVSPFLQSPHARMLPKDGACSAPTVCHALYFFK